MKRSVSVLILVVLLLGGLVAAAGAGVPVENTFKVSARVAGLTAGRRYTFTFGLYDAPSGGTPLFEESKSYRVPPNMRISHTLGSVNLAEPLQAADFLQQLWVEVRTARKVFPRIRLAPAPLAIGAQDADRLDGLDAADFAAAEHTHGGTGSGLDADLLDGQHGAFYQDAGNLAAGTLSTNRYSASADLAAEGFLGDAAGDIARNNGVLQATLNADLLDGLSSGQFLRSDTGNGVIVATAGSAAAPGFTFTGDTNTGLYSPAADTVSLTAAGAERLAVDSGGTSVRGVFTRTSPGGVIGAFNSFRYADAYAPISGAMGNSGDLYVTFDVELGASLYLTQGSIYMRGVPEAGLDGSQYLFFYNNGSRDGESIFWYDSADRFEITDDLNVQGTLTKSAGSFKIDHPLDPAGKYLYHSFVESPDMKNIYDGVVVLDADGAAVVELPEWFEALNGDFRYQLTPIGGAAPNLHVAEEVAGGRFRIAGGLQGLKVSWQVTGIRHDAYAAAHRIPVEEEKPAAERGTFLHPAELGQPPQRSLNHALREPALAAAGSRQPAQE